MKDGDSVDATGIRGSFIYDRETKTFKPIEKKKGHITSVAAVYGDEIVGGIESMVDGKTYYSKSKLRRSYKEQGYIEKGNDRLPIPKQETDEERLADIRADAEKAFYDIKYGRVPLTEKEKHEWNEEQRQMELDKKRQKTRWA